MVRHLDWRLVLIIRIFNTLKYLVQLLMLVEFFMGYVLNVISFCRLCNLDIDGIIEDYALMDIWTNVARISLVSQN